jgi:alpha-N-arabinofuranosidase
MVLSIVIGSINLIIYGQYLEHVQPEEKIIYGRIFELNSPFSDEKGIRKDVVEALKEIKIPIIR